MKSTTRLLSGLVAVAFAFVLMTSAAGAQSDAPDPYVGGTTIVQTTLPPQQPVVEAATVEQAPAAQGSALAFTGGDVLALGLVGGAAIVIGGLMVASRRRLAPVA